MNQKFAYSNFKFVLTKYYRTQGGGGTSPSKLNGDKRFTPFLKCSNTFISCLNISNNYDNCHL